MRDAKTNEAKLIDILHRQFEATLEMLGRVIDECPDEVWDVKDEPAPIWQQLYHSLIGIDGWIRDPQSPFQPQAQLLGQDRLSSATMMRIKLLNRTSVTVW